MINEMIAALALIIPAFALGAYIGWDIAARRFSRKLQDMLYDFDADKAEFDEWIAQRMAEVKDDMER